MQIVILNIFLGLSLFGWVGALIWGSIKTKKEKSNNIIPFILIQITVFISLVSFCIVDHNLYNYNKVNQLQKQETQETIEAIKTLQELSY